MTISSVLEGRRKKIKKNLKISDGTNNEVLNGIMNFKKNNKNHHDFIFGFLPLGTGKLNHQSLTFDRL